MTIISAVKTFMKTYPALESGSLVLVDYIGQPIGYSIIPLPNQRIIEKYIDGSSVREFQFAFQTAKSTADELERLDSAEFHEDLMDWFEEQTEEETLPDLGAGKTAEIIEAINWGYLYEQGTSDTGIYQIICRLEYRQAKYTPTPDSGSS
jgi:hypothetical protein